MGNDETRLANWFNFLALAPSLAILQCGLLWWIWRGWNEDSLGRCPLTIAAVSILFSAMGLAAGHYREGRHPVAFYCGCAFTLVGFCASLLALGFVMLIVLLGFMFAGVNPG